MDMVNINSNLKTSSNHVSSVISCKIDTYSDGNIRHLHLYKELFPRKTKEQLVATKNKNITLKTFNKTTVTPLGVCEVELEQNNVQKCASSL